jgi:hypothetical protein
MLQLERKIEFRLRVRCLRIAERVVFSNEDITAEQAIIEYNALFEHTENFYKFCLLELQTLYECSLDYEIIFPTLSYIERHFAVPQLLNDFSWFPDTLNTLLSFFTDESNVAEDEETHEYIKLLAKKLKEKTKDGKD